MSETKHDIALPVHLYIFASCQEFMLKWELVNYDVKTKFESLKFNEMIF